MTRASFGIGLALILSSPTRLWAKETRMSVPAFDKLLAERTRVHEVIVFHVSDATMTLITLYPEKIETYPDVEKHIVTGAEQISEIFANLVEGHPVSGGGAAECRWKLVFKDAAGKRLCELYIAGIGPPVASIGDDAFEFANHDHNPALWLRKRFSPSDEKFFSKSGSSAEGARVHGGANNPRRPVSWPN
jgi:hypothetical protein